MSVPSDAEVLAAIEQSCCVDVETFRAWLAEHDERVRLLGKVEGLREALGITGDTLLADS